LIINNYKSKLINYERNISEKDILIQQQKEKINEFSLAIDSLNNNHLEISSDYKKKILDMNQNIIKLQKSESDLKSIVENLKKYNKNNELD
jgi:hypothetical protein